MSSLPKPLPLECQGHRFPSLEYCQSPEYCQRTLVGMHGVVERLLARMANVLHTEDLPDLLLQLFRHSRQHEPYQPHIPKYPATCRNKGCEDEDGFEQKYTPKPCCTKRHYGVVEDYCRLLKAFHLFCGRSEPIPLDGGMVDGEPQPCTTLPCIFEVMNGKCTSRKCKSRHYRLEAEWDAVKQREAAAREWLERKEADALAPEEA